MAESPSFDIQALAALLEQREPETRRQVRALLDRPLFRHVSPELSKETYREQVLAWLKVVADAGLGALAYPRVTHVAPDLAAFVTAFESLAMFDLSLVVKFGVQFGLFGGAIYFLGTDEQAKALLPRVATGEVLGCFAMTELGHGSNVRDLETTATWDTRRGTFELHSPTFAARKEWIGNAAAHAQLAVVFAQLVIDGESQGVHAFVVALRDANGQPMPGVQIEDCGHKMGLNGVDNGRLRFDRVRLPRDALLGRYATVTEDGRYQSPIDSPGRRFFTMLGTLVGGRVCVAAASLTASRSALAIAIRYGVRRRQFGPDGGDEQRILDYPAQQRRLMPALATTYALHFALETLITDYVTHRGDDARVLEAKAAGLKAYATWHTTRTVQVCREACGGQGYLSSNRLPSLKADTDVFATFEGDNTVLLQLVAKAVLGAFREDFFDGSVRGLVEYLAQKVTSRLDTVNPRIGRATDTEHLRDRNLHLGALRYRETSLVDTLGRRLRARINRGMDPFVAFTEVQNHATSLALAHVERITLEAFVAAAEAQKDPALHAALDRMCDLFAICCLEDDLGWFLEQGYFEPNKAPALRSELEALCAEVRVDAEALVEAFGIPDACLAAPIAFDEPVGI